MPLVTCRPVLALRTTADPAPASPEAGLALSRQVFFLAVFGVGLANGLVGEVWRHSGDATQLLGNVSVVVWAAAYLAASLLLLRGDAPDGRDLAVAAATAAAFLVPSAPSAWVALTGFGIYIVWSSPKWSHARRAGWIITAITVPLFWSKIAFKFISGFVLRLDAVLVSSITQTSRVGTNVQFVGDDRWMVINPSCSSWANVSLAVLAWVLFMQHGKRALSWRAGAVCLLACLAVVLINVVRISAIGYFPQHYVMLHEGAGYTVASWVTLGSVLAICSYGLSRVPAANRIEPRYGSAPTRLFSDQG